MSRATDALSGALALLRGDARADRVVPPSGLTGHLTVVAAAAMAFLSALSIAFALAAGQVADRWSTALSGAATVEIAVQDREQAEALAARVVEVLRTTEGVASARLLSPGEMTEILAPWMGEGAVDLAGLPFPALVAVEEAPTLDRAALELRLEGEVPEARYHVHGTWRERVATAADRLRWLGIGAAALTLAATVIVITLAARASLAVNADVIRTLRELGARDTYIARAFVRRFTLRGLAGAAAGTIAAILLVLVLPAGDGALLAGLAPDGPLGWLILLLIPPAAGAMAFLATRRAAFRTLGRLA